MSLTKVTFSMIDKISINVRDYGATGDGTTDDAPAIQNAIDAAGAAGGGIVYFPPGTYRVATVYSQHGGTVTGVPNDDRQFLVIGYDNIRLVGDGATIFCNNVTAGFRLNMIMVYDCSNVIIENLIFDNNGLDISQSRTQAIVTQSATEIIIDKCKLQNSTFGIFIYKLSENVRISNCWFDGGWGVATGGDDLGNDPGVISDVIIENNAFLSVAGESVDINQDTRNFIIRNNFCYNSNTDVDGLTPTDAENIDIGGDDALQYGLIEGNTIIDLRQYIHGIQVKQDSVNIKIVNNRIINTANNPTDTWGIRIAPANQTMIHGNHINGYTYSINSSASASDNREIYIANNICENFYVGAIAIASNNCKIEGNLIKLVSRAGVSLGIYVAGNPENVNINGNNINVDPTLDNAIWVNGASEVNIANNNIQGSVIGIQISSVSNASCVGNTVKGCGEESLLIENSTNITANGNNFSNGNETGGTWSVTFNNVNNGIFNGNVLCDTRNSGQTMFGTVNADASCDYIIFTSNSVFNCTAANIGINGAVTNKVAANNLT